MEPPALSAAPAPCAIPFLSRIPRPWRFLAPMVSNSEEAYRLLARRHGADVCFTEMINTKVFPRSRFRKDLATAPDDRPLVAQVCGDDPAAMLAVCQELQPHFDAIDINLGCPQDIARRGHYGAFLQEDRALIHTIVSTLAHGLRVPLFCKIRVFPSVAETVAYARMIEAAGCALLTVHGRTREQRGHAAGLASWPHIRAVKQALRIPVVANGNMIRHRDIAACIAYTGCDGVMIAEPHLYNPLIFSGAAGTAPAVFAEYLAIVRTRPGSALPQHMKSHAFKIFRRALADRPEALQALGSCVTVDDFERFLAGVLALGIPAALLALGPYTRGPEVDESSHISMYAAASDTMEGETP